MYTSLHSDEFEFSTNIGGWVANSLLRWLRQVDVVVPTTVVSDNEVKAEVIGSYEEFKTVALDVYDKLNYEHNLDDNDHSIFVDVDGKERQYYHLLDLFLQSCYIYDYYNKTGIESARYLRSKNPLARLYGLRIGYKVAVSFCGDMERDYR